MSVFALSESPTVAKLNQKMVLVDTGANINSATPYAGMVAFCTETGSGFTAGKFYTRNAANDAWLEGVNTGHVVMPAAAEADYATPSAAAYSSINQGELTHTSLASQTSANASDYLGKTGQPIRWAYRYTFSGQRVGLVGTRIFKTNSPTGTLYCRIRRTSDDSIIETSSDTINVSTAFNEYMTFRFNSVVNEQVYISFEYNQGDASNYLEFRTWSTGGSYTAYKYVSSWAAHDSSYQALVWIYSIDVDRTTILNTGQNIADTTANLYTGSNIRIGERLDAAVVNGQVISQVIVKLGKQGSPTGTGYLRVRKTSDDSLVTTIGSIDVSTLTTSQVDKVFNTTATSVLTNEDHRVLFEYSGGDASNYVKISYSAQPTYYQGKYTAYVASYTDNSSGTDLRFIISIGSVIDDSTTTGWQSASEATPYVELDLGSDLLVSGIRIYWGTSGQPNGYDVDYKAAGGSYAEAYSSSTYPDGGSGSSAGWVELSFGTVLARYLRIQGDGTLVMIIYEVDYYSDVANLVIVNHIHKAGVAI